MPRNLVGCHQHSSEIEPVSHYNKEIYLVLYKGTTFTIKGMPRYKGNVQKSYELTSLYVTHVTLDTLILSVVNIWIPKTSAQVYDSHRSIPRRDSILII